MNNIDLYKFFTDYWALLQHEQSLPFVKSFCPNGSNNLPILVCNSSRSDHKLCAWIGSDDLNVDYLVECCESNKILIDLLGNVNLSNLKYSQYSVKELNTVKIFENRPSEINFTPSVKGIKPQIHKLQKNDVEFLKTIQPEKPEGIDYVNDAVDALLCESDSEIYGVYLNNILSGFIQLTDGCKIINEQNVMIKEVNGIYVAPAVRKSGVGKYLLQYICNMYKGYFIIYCVDSESNLSSLRLAGWRYNKHQPNWLKKGLPPLTAEGEVRILVIYGMAIRSPFIITAVTESKSMGEFAKLKEEKQSLPKPPPLPENP